LPFFPSAPPFFFSTTGYLAANTFFSASKAFAAYSCLCNSRAP